MSESPSAQDSVVIERSFGTTIEVVWQLWTDPEHFKQWYGPKGFSIPVADIDLRVGGRRTICMASPDGSMKMWTTGEFTAVDPHGRLSYTESPADENGNAISPADMGMPPGYPAVTEVIVILESQDSGTKMTMTHVGIPAGSPGEGGWNQAFDKLADYISST